MGTLAGLLLGAVGVSLVAEAGVGAWQVLAACIPTGVRVCALIYICKQSQQGQAVPISLGQWRWPLGIKGENSPRQEGGEQEDEGTMPSLWVPSDGGPRDYMLLTHTRDTGDFIARDPQSKAGHLDLLLKCGGCVPWSGPGTRATGEGLCSWNKDVGGEA